MSDHPSDPGLHREVAPDTNQRYVLSIPDNYGGEQPVPLVLVLHYAWAGSLPDFYGQELLENVVHPALRDLGALMVAPDCLHRDWTNPESEAEVNHLLDFIDGTYGVDRGKVIVTGYSLGGIGTWYMAACNQARFAAALPMAAIVPREAMEADWSVPLYVIQSAADEIVPFELTERSVRRLQKSGVAIEFVVLEGVTHFETGRYFRPLRDAVPWIREAWG
jgi:predicted peptidase